MKSHFVKKSVLTELGKDFKFNFPAADAMERLDIKDVTLPAKPANANEADGEKGFKSVAVLPVIPSTNSFRFNFAIETD